MPGARGDRLRQGPRLGHGAGRREGHALHRLQGVTDVQQHHARHRERTGLHAHEKVPARLITLDGRREIYVGKYQAFVVET